MGQHKDKPIFWLTADDKPVGALTAQTTAKDVHSALRTFLVENKQIRRIQVKLPPSAGLHVEDVKRIGALHNVAIDVVKSTPATAQHR